LVWCLRFKVLVTGLGEKAGSGCILGEAAIIAISWDSAPLGFLIVCILVLSVGCKS